jgi:hypothetical protein
VAVSRMMLTNESGQRGGRLQPVGAASVRYPAGPAAPRTDRE